MGKTRKPKPMSARIYDEIYTPPIALNPLLPYLTKDKRIWECAYGNGNIATYLRELGYTIIGNKNWDFLKDNPPEFDIIVTNPPYSLKYEFLKRAYELGKPFAFLLPITTLEGKKRGMLFKKYGIQLIIPNKRINFTGKKSGCWFACCWMTWKLGLERDLNFVELEE